MRRLVRNFLLLVGHWWLVLRLHLIPIKLLLIALEMLRLLALLVQLLLALLAGHFLELLAGV